MELGACRAGDEVGEGCFSQAGWAGEEDVVEHVTASLGGFEHEEDPVFYLFLTDEFRKRRRPKRDIEGRRGGGGGLLVEIF